MSKTAKFKLSKVSKSRQARKTNKLLFKYNFYIFKVFEQLFRNQAIAQWGDTHSETLIEKVKISLPIAIASRNNLGKFRIEGGGH